MSVRDWFRPPNNETTRIAFDSNCLSVSRQAVAASAPGSMRWQDVQSAFAYKKDCFAVDQIRMELWDANGSSLLITENDEGFDELLSTLPTHLPGVDSDWYVRLVAGPAFELNFQKIYEKH